MVPAAMVPSCCSKEALYLSLSSWPLRETTWSCTAKQPLRSAWLGLGSGLGLGLGLGCGLELELWVRAAALGLRPCFDRGHLVLLVD